MKKNILAISGIALGAVIASSAGVGGYYIYKAFSTKKSNFVDLGEKKEITTKWGWKIIEYPYKNGDYWLDQKGLETLKSTIEQKLYYGQEIYNLQDIVIGDVNIIDEGSNGLYFPATKEIFLNVSQWEPYNVISNEKKVDGLISTITHEYGHHIANVYLNTARVNDATYHWAGANGKTIKKPSTNEVANWSKNFTEWFYNNVGYNNQTKALGTWDKDKYNVTYKMSMNDLFWSGNGYKPSPWPLSKEQNDRFGEFVFPVAGRNHIVINNHVGDKHNTYRYSMDEIFTRQLGQLMHVQNVKFGDNYFDQVSKMVHNNKSGDKTGANTWLYDALASNNIRFQEQPNNKLQIDVKAFESADSIWKKPNHIDYVAKDFYKEMLKVMGYGDLISNVYDTDKFNVYFDQTNHNIRAKGTNGHGFKVTGWVPTGVATIKIGTKTYQLTKNNNEWQFNGKKELFSQTHNLTPSDVSLQNNLEPYISETIPFGNCNEGDVIEFGNIVNGVFVKTTINTQQEKVNPNIPVSIYRQTSNENGKYSRITERTIGQTTQKELIYKLY